MMDSEIEEADLEPSQLNFERPLELCDFMFLELQKLRKRKLEMEDLRSQSQFNHFHSQRSALTDLLAICYKRYLATMDSAPSQLDFERPLELCDSMYWELPMDLAPSQLNFERPLEYWELPMDLAPSQYNFERPLEYWELQELMWRSSVRWWFSHFHSQIVALTDLIATCKKLYRYVLPSKIEEADSAPSQLNSECPLELCDFMFRELQNLIWRTLEIDYLLLQSQFNHIHSEGSALTDLFAICKERYLQTFLRFRKSRKRNLETEDLRSQSQYNHIHSERSALTDLFAIRTKIFLEMESKIKEADSAPSQLNFERPLQLCDFMYCELQKLRKRNSEMEGLWSQLQFNHFPSQIVALTNIALQLCDFMYCESQKLRKRILKMEYQRSQSQFNHFHSQRSALPDLITACKKLYWFMSDSKIEEADWAQSRFKLEPLQQLGNFLCLDLLTVRERILEYRDLRLLSQFARQLPWPSEENNLYLFFYLKHSPVMYALYEIKVTKPFPLPPTEAVQDANKWDLSGLNLILQFETGMYPEGMCCVQLGSELYFFGGEFNLKKPNICKDLKKLKKERRDVLPRDVYIFYSTLYRKYPLLLCRLNENMLLQGRPMNSGKASPQAFVVDGMIYVIGSTFTNLDNESFAYFEVYDPVEGMWTILPNPPIRNVNTKWVGNAVVERKAVLVALQQGQNCLYCFDLDTRQWKNRVSIPDFLSGNFFSRKSEFIEDTLYGCYDNTIGAIAPLANNEDEDDDEDEDEDENEEEDEEEEVQRVERLLEYHCLHLVSVDVGVGAFFNIPGLLQSSSSLVHLENRYFCYVRVGTRPTFRHRLFREYTVIIVIFQALNGETYTEKAIATRFFRAKFVYSKHYKSFLTKCMGLFIKGCYALG